MTYISNPAYTIESQNNSTNTPLAGSASFTGTADTNNYPTFFIDVRTDAECTVYTEFSVDGGTNWTRFPVSGYKLNASNNYTLVDTATKAGRSYRLVIENGSTAQTFLRAFTYFGVFDQLNAPLNQSYSLQSGSRLVRPSWTWLDAARGLTGGLSGVKKFGRNDSVGTGFEPVCMGGIYMTPQSSAATTLRIKAGNANDSAGGSGARAVTLIGLDESFNEVQETVATNGTSPSAATSATFTRLYRAFVSSSGTYASASAGSHFGDIVIENSAGTQDWGTIDAANFPKSQSEIGAISIAAGKTGYVKLRDLSIDSGKTIDLVFFSRANIDETAPPYTAMRAQSVVSGVSGGSIETFGSVDIPFGPYTGPTDIGFMAKVASGTASVSVEFEVFILDE